MRITIKDVKELAKKNSLTHCIVFGFDGKQQCVATYGANVEQCDQAAEFGNNLKTALGWPDKLCHDEPSRVRQLKNKIKQLEKENQQLKDAVVVYKV